MLRKALDQHIHHKKKKKKKKSKQASHGNFVYLLLIKLPWSTFHVKIMANLQSRAGRDFWVACNLNEIVYV